MLNPPSRRSVAWTCAVVLASMAPGVGLGTEKSSDVAIAEMTVSDIEACIERAAPEKSSMQKAKLRAVDREGEVTESHATIYWKKTDEGLSRAMVRFSAPPDLRGSALLLLEKEDEDTEMFIYLPEFGNVRRVTMGMMSGSMFGTDFTYEEFERLYGLSGELDSKRLEDSVVDEQPVFVLEGVPKEDEDSAYERIVQYVEQERCIPLKSEFFEGRGEATKVLSVDPATVRRVKSAWVPSQVQMRNLRENTHTDLVFVKVAVDVEIPDRVFSQRSLSKGH